MPIYEYRCASCGFQKEYLQKMSDAPMTDCPDCGKATLGKMVTAAGFHLKGSGWYATDFKHGKPQSKPEDKSAIKPDESAGAKAEDKSASKSEDRSESKSEDKSAGKAEDKPAPKSNDKSAPEAPAKKSDEAASTPQSRTRASSVSS